MKKITIILLGLFAIIGLQAQNYYIDFTASGAATTLDSVFVENLTQSTSLTLQGSDTLHLTGTVGISSHTNNSEKIKIYPNPFNETSHLEFCSESSTVATIDVYDAVGKHIVQLRQDIQKGNNIFGISGFPTGHYHLIVKTETWQKSASIISINTASQSPQIELKSAFTEYFQLKSTDKGTKNIVPMPYTTGDQMQFTAYSGSLSDVVTDVPASSKTIDFVFTSFSCGDTLIDTRDGNVYTTVQIGNQCWMAENLAHLPSVVGPSTGSETTPYYYVYGYNGTSVSAAKATAYYNTYGVLYNWPAAMNGAVSSTANPSGVQGICPAGWHLPSNAEWVQMESYLVDNGYNYDGTIGGGPSKIAKSLASTSGWTSSSNTGAVGNTDFPSYRNKSGFTALPAGGRWDSGNFNRVSDYGLWWSATENGTGSAWGRDVYYDSSNVHMYNYSKDGGFSVRCIRNF